MSEREIVDEQPGMPRAEPSPADDAGPAGGGASERTGPNGEGSLTSDRVLEALKDVYDPELGINIVDLGLVYEIDVAPGGDVDIRYTLTTMGCPIGPLIEDQMRALLAQVPGVGEVRPEMVLRPAWTPEMMSEEAKAALGMF